MSIDKSYFWAIVLILIIGVFYLGTLREGHEWGDDFSQYILHAKNIVEGREYSDTGYIYNRFHTLGPQTYPPIFPLCLAPVYKWFGLDLAAMKTEIVIFFALSLLIIFLAFRNHLPSKYVFAIIALLGFSPHFWSFKDQVLSDIPFLFFLYVALLFLDRTHVSFPSQKHQLFPGILGGLFIYLAFGTRAVGLVIILCLYIFDRFKFKKLSQFTLLATASFLVLLTSQFLLTQTHKTHWYYFQLIPRVIAENLLDYARGFGSLWNNGYSRIFQVVLFTIISLLAGFGYLGRLKRKVTIYEIFLPAYLAVIIFWPGRQGLRFLLPVIPLYLFYTFEGVRKLGSAKFRWIEKTVFIGLMLAILTSYIGAFTKMDFGPIREGPFKKQSLELFAYVKSQTEKDGVFIFRKPRVFYLLAERRASVYHLAADGALWDFMTNIRASYLIVSRVLEDDQEFLRPFIERNRDKFDEVYGNSDFTVYKIKPHRFKE